jgi:hypothetical protein
MLIIFFMFFLFFVFTVFKEGAAKSVSAVARHGGAGR